MSTSKTKRIKEGDIVEVRGFGCSMPERELSFFNPEFGGEIKFRVLKREGNLIEVGDLDPRFADLRWSVYRFQVRRV